VVGGYPGKRGDRYTDDDAGDGGSEFDADSGDDV
jgi:hypothetical protein